MSRIVAALHAVGAVALIVLPSLHVDANEPPPPPKSVAGQSDGSVSESDGEEPLVIEFDNLSLFVTGDVKVIPIPESLRSLDGRRVQIDRFQRPGCCAHGCDRLAQDDAAAL